MTSFYVSCVLYSGTLHGGRASIEADRDLYKDVMMEKRPPLSLPDGSRNTPDRCPHSLHSRDSTQEYEETSQAHPTSSQDSTQEHCEILQDGQVYTLKIICTAEENHHGIPRAHLLHPRDSKEEDHEIPQDHFLYPQDFKEEHHEIPQDNLLFPRDSKEEHHEIPQDHLLYPRSPKLEHYEIPQDHLLYPQDSKQEHHEIPQDHLLYPQDAKQEHHKVTQTHLLCLQDSTQEHHEIPQDEQGEIIIKTEVKEEAEDPYVRSDEPCKEEEHSLEISSAPEDTTTIQRDIKVEEMEGGQVTIKEEEVPVEISTDKTPAKRRSYSVEFKKAIVEDSCGKNLTAYCKEKNLDLRLVRKWRADYNNLNQKVDEGYAKKRKCGSGRQTLFPELEDIICEWISDKRAKALIVRRADIQAFALATASQLHISPQHFKASQHWLDNFLQRYELTVRKSAMLFKLKNAEAVKRAETAQKPAQQSEAVNFNMQASHLNSCRESTGAIIQADIARSQLSL